MLGEELLPSLRIDIPDFIHAVVGHIPPLDELAETVFDLCRDEGSSPYIDGSGWTMWPPSANEELVLEWLQDLMKPFMAWVNEHGVHPEAYRQIYNGLSTNLDGPNVKRKMDFGVMACHGKSKSDDNGGDVPIPDWAQILMAGDLKSNLSKMGRIQCWSV